MSLPYAPHVRALLNDTLMSDVEVSSFDNANDSSSDTGDSSFDDDSDMPLLPEVF